MVDFKEGDVEDLTDRYAAGISDCTCDVPEGWHTVAKENYRVMEEDRATNSAMQTQAQTATARAAQIGAANSAPSTVVVQPQCTVIVGGRCQ
jgi:hypothetical protein